MFENMIEANSDAGICLSESNHNDVWENNIIMTNSGDSISLLNSMNNNIFKNNLTQNFRGLRLDSSCSNNISKNDVARNDWSIDLYNSSSNKFYHNNFINNTNEVWSIVSLNIWDDGYPSGGNYWSVYSGEDVYSGSYQNETGSDGIGDTQYSITGDNPDRYPLMKPWASPQIKTFDVIWENVHYPVLTISNSTITHFTFDQLESQISFNVTGTPNSEGFCKVTIPDELLWGNFSLFFDGALLIENVNYTKVYNGTHYSFNLTYTHCNHNIRIIAQYVIPENPCVMFSLLLLVAITAIIIALKKKKRLELDNHASDFH